VETLVMTYQEQFAPDASEEACGKSKAAASELLEKFKLLFKKYVILIKTAHIDWDDAEQKAFVLTFMDEPALKRALRRERATSEFRTPIYRKFNFVRETYGHLPEQDIVLDLQVIFMTLAKRYKQMGKSFCGYIYRSFKYEVSRHIKNFTANPGNIHYRNTLYQDYMVVVEEKSIETDFDDQFYENNIGIPDTSWISGANCSDLFHVLNSMERRILVKYYVENWNDRQIAEQYQIHINTVNQKRRQAVTKLAAALGISEDEIKRSRKSGKGVVVPLRSA